MYVEHEYDNMAGMGNHLIWRSQHLIKERSRSGRLHADHVPGGVVINLGECSCTHTKHLREHDVVWSVYEEDLTTE